MLSGEMTAQKFPTLLVMLRSNIHRVLLTGQPCSCQWFQKPYPLACIATLYPIHCPEPTSIMKGYSTVLLHLVSQQVRVVHTICWDLVR